MFSIKYYYLLWAVGLTAGSYIGSKYPAGIYLNVFYALFTIILMSVSGFFTVKKFLHKSAEDSLNYDNRKILTAVIIVVSFFAFLLIGCVNFSAYNYRESKNIFYLIEKHKGSSRQNIILDGRVASYPKYSYGNLYFLLEADRALIVRGDKDTSTTFKADGHIKVKIKNCDPGFLLRDDYIRVDGYINLSKDTYLKNSDKLIFVSEVSNVEKIMPDNFVYTIFRLRGRVYKYLENVYFRSLNYESASIAEALVLGNKSDVPGYVLENFKKSGVFHLLAISGLHISILLYFINWIFRKINFFTFSFWLIFIFLLIYNFLVGEKASMQRATIMFVFVILAGMWGREYSQRIVLYFTYIAMILSNPSFFYDLGFWLSFSSMAAIIFVSPVLLKFLSKIFPKFKIKESYVARMVVLTISVQAVLTPTVSYFFGGVSTVAVAANLIIIPAFYAALLLLFVSSVFSMIWMPLGAFILKPASIFINYILRVTAFLGKLDFSFLSLGHFHMKYVIIYYAVLLAALCVLKKYLSRSNSYDQKKEKAIIG